MHGRSGDEDGNGAPVVLGHVSPFRLGPLLVEPALRRLSSADGERFIQPRVMQVLVALARADGGVVTRDDLIESCWGGTIVGDDALNRIVSHVRKLADGIGGGGFSVETVARVGYRLRPGDAGVREGAPVPAPPALARGAPAASMPRRRGLGVAVAIAGTLLFAIGLAWWLIGASPARPLTVGLGRIETIGRGLPEGLARSVEAELRTAFGARGVAVTSGEADLVVGGAIRRVGGERLRLSTQVSERASGAMLWSSDGDASLADAEAPARLARVPAAAVDCLLSAAVRHSAALPAGSLALGLQLCGEDDLGRQLALARRLTAAEPDFWLGWHHVAYAIAGRDIVADGRRDPALFEEARRAADRVIALRPDDAEGHSDLALVLPPDRATEREAMLRRATVARPEECGCAFFHLGDFLIQSGRGAEAVIAYREGLAAQDGPYPLSMWRLAMGLYLTDRVAAGDRALGRIGVLADPRLPRPRRLRFHAAAWTGRWDEAGRWLDAPRADEQAALGEALAALAAGDPARIGAARAAVERLPAQADSELLVVPLLAALGGTDSVFARLEASRARGGHFAAPGRLPGAARPLLFDPLLRPLWGDPRFAAFLQRAGFIAYWRESGSRPDICRGDAAPGFCRSLGPARPRGQAQSASDRQ